MTLPAIVPGLSGRVRNGIALLFALGVAHVALSLQALPVVGLLAIAHLFFPPAGAWGLWDLAVAAPLFALMVYGGGATCAGLLWSAAQSLRARLSRPLRWAFAASLALWALVAAGEGIRLTLMHTQLTDSPRACHATWSLMASLRQRYTLAFDEFEDGRHPHAWRVRGDTVSLWSYRTLRFEPAPGWYGAADTIAQCRSGAGRR
ncbi:MAG: hypothetical protein ACTHOH_04700 [Lysobacteraceae bacterium]